MEETGGGDAKSRLIFSAALRSSGSGKGEPQMNPNKTKYFLALEIVVLCLAISGPLRAHASRASLSGTVTSSAGAVLANPKISTKNGAAGQSSETQSNSTGQYNLTDLNSGDYEI